MSHADVIRSIFVKYKLAKPVPAEVREEIFSIKRQTLSAILKEKNEDSFFVRIIIAFFFSIKRPGLSLSMARSAAVVSAMTFACVSIITLSVSLMLTGIFGKKPIENRAVAISIIGDAKLIRLGSEPAQLSLGGDVLAGDTVRTGGLSMAVLQAGLSAVVRISENTTVKISAISRGKTGLFLSRGKILLNAEKLSEEGELTVKTLTTTAAIHGTLFSVSYDGTKTVVSVSRGAVMVNEKGAARAYSVEADKAVNVTEEVRMRPITDEERADLLKLSDIRVRPDIGSLNDSGLEKLNKEIILKSGETGLDTLKTLDNIKKKYGRIDVLYLFNGRVIRGAIITRGAEYIILTPGGTITIPADQVENMEIVY